MNCTSLSPVYVFSLLLVSTVNSYDRASKFHLVSVLESEEAGEGGVTEAECPCGFYRGQHE